MSSELKSRQIWAKNLILNSGKPFAEETLEQVGEVEGITIRRSDGKLTTTGEMTAEILHQIGQSRRRFSVITRLDQGSFDTSPHNDNPSLLN